MPTFQEVVQAAMNADKAGNKEAAASLMAAAKQMKDGAAPEQQPLPADLAAPHDPRGDLATPKEPGWADNVKTFLEPVPGDTYGDILPVKRTAAGALQPAIPNMAREVIGSVVDFVDAPRAAIEGEIDPMDTATQEELAQGAFNTFAGGAGGGIRVSKSAIPKALEKKAAKPPTDRQAAAIAADDLGIAPTLGMTGRGSAVTSAALSKNPVTASTMEKDVARVVGDIEDAFKSTVGKTGAKTNEEGAGTILQGGLKKFTERFANKSAELYGKVDELVPEDVQIAAPNTVKNIRDVLRVFESNPEIAKRLGLNEWSDIADALEKGLSWRAARDLRTQLGQSIGKMKGSFGDLDDGRIKQAYASLSDDLELAAKNAGHEAEAAWSRANKYYAGGRKRIDDQLDKLIKPDSPERAFELFAAMTKDGASSSDINRLRRLKSSLEPDEWKDISATIVDRMGRATKGNQDATGEVFSPNTFLTNYNKMSKGARDLIAPPHVRKELDDLAKISSAFKDASKMESPSGSAIGGGLMGAAAWSAIVSGPAAVVGYALAAGGLALGAKAMTHPAFLRALNKAARGDMKQIKAMASGKGPFAKDAKTILRLTAAEAQAGNQAANQGTAPLRAVSTP